VTGLQDLLDAKADVGHLHIVANVTGLQAALAAKSDITHTHVAADVTDFSEAADARVAAVLVAGANVTITPTAGTLVIAASDGGGSSPTTIWTMEVGRGFFSGTLIGNFTYVDLVNPFVGPEWTYDNYEGSFQSTIDGTFEVVVEGTIVGGNSDGLGNDLWPDGLSAYGVDLRVQSPATTYSRSTRAHTRYSPDDSLTGNFGLQWGQGADQTEPGEAANTATFTERWIVVTPEFGKVIPQMFATSYSSAFSTAVFSMVISFKKIG
jgi:hypothetical protein